MHDLIFFIAGLVVGSMNAVAGGGMLVGFPVMVALGLPPLVANVTANVISGPSQLASVWGYRKYVRQIPRRFVVLIIPIIIGSAAGALVLRHTSASNFAGIVPGLVFFGVVLFAIQPLLHFRIVNHLHGKHKGLAPLLLMTLTLLPLSFYGGYFGAGLGFLTLALLGFAHMTDLHIMSAIRNIVAVCVSATSIAFLFSTGLIDWKVGVIMGSGGVIGGYSGARLSQRLSSHWLRIAVIIIGLAAVVYLALQRY